MFIQTIIKNKEKSNQIDIVELHYVVIFENW
jgi:hypothetical protein